MILAPARRGSLRGREPVQPRRPLRRQPGGAQGDVRGLRAAAALRVARPRLHLAERAQAERRLRGAGRREALQRARHPRGRPEGVPVRRGAEGRHQAVRVQGLRHAPARRSTRSGPAWSRRRAPAPPTTTTGASPGRRSSSDERRGGLRARAEGPADHRDRAREAPPVQGRDRHHGPRRRRQGDPDADRGPAGAGAGRRRARRWRRWGTPAW